MASCPFAAPATGCGAAPGLVRSSVWSELTRLFLSQSVVEIVNTAVRPSGDTSGAPMRCIECISVAVIGRAYAVETASAAAAAARRNLEQIMRQAWQTCGSLQEL